MAKKGAIEINNKRKRLAKKYAAKRARLLAIARDRSLPMEERFAAQLKLAKLPRNSAPVRIRNRCEISGRPRQDCAARAFQQGPDSGHDESELVTTRDFAPEEGRP